MARQEKTFVRRNYGTLYKWSVRSGSQGKKKKTKGGGNIGCTAVQGSQGQDWTNGYVYEQVVIDGQIERLGYVACGYVA